MATESIALPSVTSTLTQHGGPQAAMSVSSSDAEGNVWIEQASAEPKVQTLQEASAHVQAAELRRDKALIEKEAQELQDRLDSLSKVKGWTINFSLVPELDQPVIKVIDADTKQVIRQIPSEEMLLISKRLQSLDQTSSGGVNLSGLLFDGQV
ncbi:flagellar protein FlaG [Aeromonas sp. AE23HZ002T15]